MGIEPITDCLQSILAPLEHVSPRTGLFSGAGRRRNRCLLYVLQALFRLSYWPVFCKDFAGDYSAWWPNNSSAISIIFRRAFEVILHFCACGFAVHIRLACYYRVAKSVINFICPAATARMQLTCGLNFTQLWRSYRAPPITGTATLLQSTTRLPDIIQICAAASRALIKFHAASHDGIGSDGSNTPLPCGVRVNFIR